MQLELLTSELQGLSPSLGLLVGQGYSREEVKEQLLENGIPVSAWSVTTLSDLALKVMGLDRTRLLGASSRIEILKNLFKKPAFARQFPSLNRLRRQRRFYERLDHAIQEMRQWYAHEDELMAFHGVLDEKKGPRELRHEMARITVGFEAILQGQNGWDEPRLVREATQNPKFLSTLSLPSRMVWISDRSLLSREKAFLQTLGIQVENFDTSCEDTQPAEEASRATVWHTLDDAVEGLLDDIQAADPDWNQEHAILIPNDSQLRWSLMHSLRKRGWMEEAGRDPLFWKHQEDAKNALIPFHLLQSRFSRETVTEWVLITQGHSEAAQLWIKEIADRGVRRDLRSYEGGKLSDLHTRLKKIADSWKGKKTLEEIQALHLDFLKGQKLSGTTFRAMEAMYIKMKDEKEFGFFQSNPMPIWYWFERIRDRMGEWSAPAPQLRSPFPLQVFRYHQRSLRKLDRVWVLGVQAQDLIVRSLSTYALNDSERETLNLDFEVDTAQKRTQTQMNAFLNWFRMPLKSIHIHSAQYSWSGGEREPIDLLNSFLHEKTGIEFETQSKGAHPRWAIGYTHRGSTLERDYDLHDAMTKTHLSASGLDRYSRCGFSFLAQHLWKLEDARSPELDLWPEVRGQILHDAVHFHLKDGLKATDAVEAAWAKSSLRGWLKSSRTRTHIVQRMAAIVETFITKEKEYQERAGTKIHSLDDEKLEFTTEGVTIEGRPDRIDRHKDGWFIMDFKSSSALPNGRQMIGEGYRLQLPFYAVAWKEKTKETVLGLQLVELTRAGARSKGVFFEKWNGKKEGSLTNTRAKLSLFAEDPDHVWQLARDQITSHVQQMKAGHFPVSPKSEIECRTCTFIDLCGKKRLKVETEVESDSET